MGVYLSRLMNIGKVILFPIGVCCILSTGFISEIVYSPIRIFGGFSQYIIWGKLGLLGWTGIENFVFGSLAELDRVCCPKFV